MSHALFPYLVNVTPAKAIYFKPRSFLELPSYHHQVYSLISSEIKVIENWHKLLPAKVLCPDNDTQVASNNQGNRADNVPRIFAMFDEFQLTDKLFEFQVEIYEKTIAEERIKKRYGFALVFIDRLENLINKKIDYNRSVRRFDPQERERPLTSRTTKHPTEEAHFTLSGNSRYTSTLTYVQLTTSTGDVQTKIGDKSRMFYHPKIMYKKSSDLPKTLNCNSHKSNKDDARDTKRCLRRRSMGSVERRRPCRGTRKELKEGIVDPTQLPKQSQATVSLRSMHAFDHHRPLICAVAPFFVRTEK
ncbi:CLUMA_CG004753, isoform A [Clunio marinus]|uniref:CLUMA_CG004753, isoform A n=1 Tax=Clunio marinus TaxID=568069 RepID=A0A1J1HY51_9DIPT|nr:CLUMA_CG004753, isoform A [Clunio marinus]